MPTDAERIIKLSMDLMMASRALDMTAAFMDLMKDRMLRADAEIQALKIENMDLKAELERK